MIDQIGIKRFVTICILAGLAIVMILANLYMIGPNKESSKLQLSTVQSEASKLQGEVDKMKADYLIFEKQKAFFASINKMGFFNDQDRILARERFETMQRLSKVISAKYEIKSAAVLSDNPDVDPDFVVLESPISLTLSAIDDIDIYRFVYYLNYGFPGFITINDVNMERKADVTPSLIKEIGTGKPPEVISAKLQLTWTTMARKDSITPASAAPADPNAVPASTGAPQ